MSYIVAEQMGKSFGSGAAAVHAVRDLNFRIAPGEFVAIMGPSGAGKSTLLAMLGAMNAPTTGRLQVDGIDVYALSPDQLADFRREYLGFVFQSFHLVPYLAVIENVMLPLAGGRQTSREKRRLAEEALAQVGLAGKAERLPGEISGGEKERVAVARAIVNEPPVLLADESTGNLDSENSREIMRMFQRKYYHQGSFPEVDKVSGATMYDTILVGQSTCHACVIACGRVVKLEDGAKRKALNTRPSSALVLTC